MLGFIRVRSRKTVASAPDAAAVVKLLVSKRRTLALSRDPLQRTAHTLAAPLTKRAIDDVVQFCGRLRILSTVPEHLSSSCAVFRAVDVDDLTDDPRV